MTPHCAGWVADAGGFNSACRQIVMLLVVVHAPPGGFGGLGQKIGAGGLEFTGICAGSILEACSTALITPSTVASVGEVFGGVQVAHDARAAVITPCCAACVIVE